MCDCILDHHEKPPGAADTDCCSGLVRERLNKKWCQPTECVEQGKLMKGKGGRCCASTSTGLTYNWTLPCGCVPGGTVQAEKNGARCCSKEINSTTQKCKWKPPKGKVEEHFNETECFSGQMNEDKLCLCMAPFSRMRHKDDVAQNREKCCSGYTISKEGSPHHGLCGCIKNGDKLGFGSDESHCCSGSAVGGVCTCIPPGGKFSAGEGMTKYECCSSRAGSEFCLCSSSNSSGSPNACCTDLAADGSCPCIRDGHALPLTESENPDAVCCSEQTPKQKEQCSRTCGKAEAVPDRKKDPAEDEPDCYDESVQEQLANMCKLPGELIFEEFRCQRCQKSEKSSWDSYPRCRVKCCDTAVDVKDDMCQCTPYGRSYDFTTSWPVGLASAGSAAKCCGRNAQDQASLLRKGVCGCSTVGASVGIGGTEADCCSEKMEDGICVPGACAKKGERGRCCRVASDMRMRLNLGICPCFHSGEVPNPSDDVTWENCCSGGKNDAGTACGCVSDPKLTLHKTAQDSDCCSGKRTPDKQHCVAPASDCLRVGVEAQDEEKCCSKSKDETNKCKCIPSGKDVPAGGTASDCCSGKFKGETRVCARLETGGPVPNGTKPEDVCLSGRLDAGSDNELKCGCVSPGKKAPDSSQCCSNDLSSSGTCQCIPHGSALNGGTEEFCCSGLASATGVCLCAPPGAPPKGRAEEMCCSKIYGSKDLHCGCLGKNAQLSSPDEGVHCCGGFFNFIPEKLRCRCLEDGHAIQKWVKEDACCSDKKNGDVCR